MTKEDLKRKLTTILSADAVGFGQLMCRDETSTVITLTAYRKVMSELVERHRGRVVDAVGDNLLAEFSCAVDAVASAVTIQTELCAQNERLPPDRQMRFRIGINYGEVIAVDGRIYGTGVNIAARLESQADPGGICISRPVLGRVENIIPLKFQYLGLFSVKNICKKVDVYRVVQDCKEPEAGRIGAQSIQ